MVCQNQSIDDSDAPLARDLRLLVRERIEAGDSDHQVIDFLVARYGEFVLLKPRSNARTLLLWLVPPLRAAGWRHRACFDCCVAGDSGDRVSPLDARHDRSDRRRTGTARSGTARRRRPLNTVAKLLDIQAHYFHRHRLPNLIPPPGAVRRTSPSSLSCNRTPLRRLRSTHPRIEESKTAVNR